MVERLDQLECPRGLTEQLGALVRECLGEQPQQRPSFAEIEERAEQVERSMWMGMHL